MSRLNTQNFGFNVRVNGTQLSKIANLNRELGDTATSLRAVEAGLAKALATVDKSVSKVVGVETSKIRGLEQQIDQMRRDLSELSNRVNQQANQHAPGGPVQSAIGSQVIRTSGRTDKFFRENFGISDATWREYNPKSGTKGKGGDRVPGGSFGTPMHGRGQYDISQVLDMIMVNRVTRPITQKLDDVASKIAAAMKVGVVPGQGVPDAAAQPIGGRAHSSGPLRGIYIARDRGEFTGQKREGVDQHLRSQGGVAVDTGVSASESLATKEIMANLRAEAARLSLRSLGINPMKGNDDQLGEFNSIIHKLTKSNTLPGDMPAAALGLLKQSYGDHPGVAKRLGSKEFAEESQQKLIDIVGGKDPASAEMRGRLSAQYSQFTGIDQDAIEERLIEAARQQATRSKRYSDILATLGQSKDLGAQQVESANNQQTGPPVSAFVRSRQQFFDKTGALDNLTTDRRAALANTEVFELVRDYYAKNNYVDYHGSRKRPPKNGLLLEDALVNLEPEIDARGELFGVHNRLRDDKAKANFLSSVRQHAFDESTDGRGTIRTPKASLAPDLVDQFESGQTGFSGRLAASSSGNQDVALAGAFERLSRVMETIEPSLKVIAGRLGRSAASRTTTTENVSESRGESPLVTRRSRSFDPLGAHPNMSGVRPKGAMGNTDTPLGDRWQDAFVRAGLYGSAATVLYGGTSQVYQGLSTINEFDKQMNTIRQVLNPLGADLDEISHAARDMGQEFGRSIQLTAEAMTIYAQMGKTQVEILRESRVALIGANVTRMEAVKVVEALTAAERQFNLSSSESMRIMDAWNEVSNTTSVTAEVLTKALLNAGSVARSAGIDFDTFNGITAAVGEATRKSGEQIGTSMRFIFQNMRSPDAIRSLQEVGINTVSLEGNFLSARNAIGQLAGAWEDLTDVQRVNVAQSIAGTRRANDFIVLMETWDRAMDITVTSLTSQGSAMRENDVAMESLSKKLEQLKASYEDLWVTLSDSGALDVLKNITDATSNLLKMMSGGASIGGGFLGSIVGIGGTIGASATGVGLIGQGLAAAQYTGMDVASRSGEKKTSIGRIVMAQQEAGAAAEVAASEALFRKRLNSGATNQVAAMLGAGMPVPGDLTERQRDVLMRAQRRGGRRSFSLDGLDGEEEGLTLAQRKGKMQPDAAPQPFLGGSRTMKLLGLSIGAQVARNAYHQMRPESPYGETDRLGQGIDMTADVVSSGALMSMFYKRRGPGGEPGLRGAIRRQGIGRSAAIGFLGTAMASNLYTQFSSGSKSEDPDRVELNRLRAYRDRLGNTSGDLISSIRSAKRGELNPQASGDLFDAVRALVPGGATQTGDITSDLQVALQTIRGAEGSVRGQVSTINQALARQTLNSDEVQKALRRRDELDLESNRSTTAEPVEQRLARLSEQYTLRETISGRLRPLMTAQAIEAGRSQRGVGTVDREYLRQIAEALQSTTEQEARSFLGNFIRGAGGYGVDVNQLLGDRSAVDTLGGDSYIQLDQEGGIFRLSDMQKVADTVEQWRRDTTLAGDHLLKAWEQIDTIAVTQPEDLSKLIGEYNETVRRLTGRNESILRHIEFLNDTLGQGFGGASGLLTGASGEASARSIGALRSFEESGVRNFDGVSIEGGPQGIANAIREMIGEVRLASENDAGIALSGRANAVLKTVGGEQELSNSIRLFVDRFLTESNTGDGDVDEFSIEAVQAQLQRLLPNNFDEINRIKGVLSNTDTPEDRARLTERTYRLATQETRAKTRPDEDTANQLVTKGLQTYLTSFQTEMQSLADQFAFERTSNPALTVDAFMSRSGNAQTVAGTRVVIDAINEAITQLRQTAADNDDRVGESADRLAQQFEATAASLKPLDDVAATLSSLADGADRLRGSLNRIGNLSQEGSAFGRTGVQSDQFEIDFLRREREKIVSGSGAYGDLTDGQRQTAAVDLQSRIRQAEERISSTQGRRDLLRGGVSESVLNYRLESILGTGGGTGAKPFAEAAIEQLREAAQSIIADVSPDLTGLDDSQQSRVLQQIADSLAPAGSAIRDLVNANGLGSRQDYLLSSPGNQAVADRVQELLRQGASVDEVFADPYARQAAQNNPLLRDLINKGLDTELQQAAIRLSEEGNEYLKDLPAIKALIAQMVGGQSGSPAPGYSRGTMAATGTPDVDASGRISKPEVMARLHQGEIVLTKDQSEEYLKNSFARGTLPRDPSKARGSMDRFGFPVLGNLDHPILDQVAEALKRLPDGFDGALGNAGFQLTVADVRELSRFYKIDPREIVEDFGFFEPNHDHIAMVSSNVDDRIRNLQIAQGADTFAHEAGHAVDRARGRKLYPDAMDGQGFYRSEVMFPDVWDTMNGSRAQEVVDKIGYDRFEKEFFPPIYSKHRDEAFADAFAMAHGFKPGYAKTKGLNTYKSIYQPAVDDALVQAKKFTSEYRSRSVDVADTPSTKSRSSSLRAKAIRDFEASIHGPYKVGMGSDSTSARSLLSKGVGNLRKEGFAGLDAGRASALLDATEIGLGDLGDSTHAEFRTVFDTQNNNALKTNKITLGSVRAHSKDGGGLLAAIVRKLSHEGTHGALLPTSTHLIETLFAGDERAATMSRTQAILKKVWEQTRAKDTWGTMGAQGYVSKRYRDTKGLAKYEELISNYVESKGKGIHPDHPIGKLAASNVDFLVGADGGSNVIEALKRGELTPDQARALVLGNIDRLESMDFSSPGLISRIIESAGNRLKEGSRGFRSLYGATRSSFGRMRGGTQQLLQKIGQTSSNGLHRAGRFYNDHIEGDRIWGSMLNAGADLGGRSLDFLNERMLVPGARAVGTGIGRVGDFLGSTARSSQQFLEKIGQASSNGLHRAGHFYNQRIEGNRIWGTLLGAGADLGARSLDLFNERMLVPGARAIGAAPSHMRGLWSQAGAGIDRASDWAADGMLSMGRGARDRIRGLGASGSEYALSRLQRAQITASRMGNRASAIGRRAMDIGGRVGPGAIRTLGVGAFGLEIAHALGYTDLDEDGAMSTVGMPGAIHAAQVVDLQQYLYGNRAARNTFTGLNLRRRLLVGGARRLGGMASGSRFEGLFRGGSRGLRYGNRLAGPAMRAMGKGLLAHEVLAAGNFAAGLGVRGARGTGLIGENTYDELMGAQGSIGTMLNQPFGLAGAGIQSTFNAATGAGFDGSLWQDLRGRNNAINTYQVALEDSLLNEGTRGQKWGRTSAFAVSQVGSLFGVDRAIEFADSQRVASIKDTTMDLNRIFGMPLPMLADANAYTAAAEALRDRTGGDGGASTDSPLKDRHDQLGMMLDGDGTDPGLREAIEAYVEFNRGYGDQVPQENRDRLQAMRDRVKAHELEQQSLQRFMGSGRDTLNHPLGQAFSFAQSLRNADPDAYAEFMRRSTMVGLQRAARSTGLDMLSIDRAQMEKYANFAASMPPSTTLGGLLQPSLNYDIHGNIPLGRDHDWGDGANLAWVDHIRESLKAALSEQQTNAIESHWKKQSDLMRGSGSPLGFTGDFEDLGEYQARWQSLTGSMSRVGSGSPRLVSDIDRLLQEVGSPLVGDGDELKLQENIRRVSRAISRDLFPRYAEITTASDRLPTQMDALVNAFTSLPHDAARRRAYPPYAGGKVTAEQLVGVDRMPAGNAARDAWARLQRWQQSAYGNTGQLSEYAKQTSLLGDSDARQQALDSTFQINRVRDERGRLLTKDPLSDKYAFGTTRLELEGAIRRDQIQLRSRQRLSRQVEGRLGLVSRVLDNEGTTNSDRFWQLIGRVGTPALATLGRQYVDLTGQIEKIQSSSDSGDSANAQSQLAELMRRRNDLSDPSMNGGRDYDRALLQAILTMHRQLKAGGGTDTAAGGSRYDVDNASVSDSIDRIAQGTRHAGGMLTPEFNYLAKTGEAIVPQKHFDEFMSEAATARDSLYSQSSGRDTMRDDADQYMASQGHDGGRVQHDVRGEVNVTADSGFEGLMRQMIDAVNRQVAGGGSPARGQRIPRQLSSEG